MLSFCLLVWFGLIQKWKFSTSTFSFFCDMKKTVPYQTQFSQLANNSTGFVVVNCFKQQPITNNHNPANLNSRNREPSNRTPSSNSFPCIIVWLHCSALFNIVETCCGSPWISARKPALKPHTWRWRPSQKSRKNTFFLKTVAAAHGVIRSDMFLA